MKLPPQLTAHAACRQPFVIPTPEGDIAWALCAPLSSRTARPAKALQSCCICQLLPAMSIHHCFDAFRLRCSDACRICLSHRNSEIYNHEEVKAQHLPDVRIVKDSKSDSAIIGHLYQVRRPALSCSSLTCLDELSLTRERSPCRFA